MKKLQILTSTAVIGLASAGVPALAQEANSELATATSVNEPAIVEKPTTKTVEKSSEVKPALDAQKQVVEKTKEQLTDAQDKANDANNQVSSAQTEVTEATDAVKHAEEIASKATPQNIEANKTDQKANLADQKANETETANTDAKIATQTETVTKAQTGVSTAEQELKDANADVSAKETQVQSAKDAISGTGLAQAEDKLDEAKAETKGAEKNVTLADTALTDAKKADEKRQETIDNAQADVDAKATLVNDAKSNLESATTKANGATTTLSQAEDKLYKATKALDSVDIVKIPDLTQFKEDIASGDDDFMTDSGAKAIENTETSIGKNAKSQPVDIDNLTQAQKEEISHLYVQGLKQVREQLKDNSKYLVTSKENTGVTKEAIELATSRAREYEQRGKSPLTHGHIGAGVENLERLGSKDDFKSMYNLKEAVVKALLGTSFDDAHSNWGHLKANLNFAKNVGLDIANINGDYWLVIAFSNKGTTLVNPTNAEAIQKAYEDAKAEKDTAQTASEKANDALKQASTDYANALDLKTSAEKILADATATPIQTTVAENNLRLAKLALDSAQKRQAEAQKAVDNFSADLASKKQALDDAKSALESAKRVQEQKVQALADVKTEVTKQESKLEALKAKKAKLIEEKDSLVKEAKALEEKLKAYVEAPINLAKAQTTLAEKQDALKNAEAKAKSAKNLVDAIATTLEAEQVKLNKIQDKFDKLQDLEEKAKDNVIATLPDGTIIAIPNGAPTADELPKFDISSLNRVLDDNKVVTIDDKGNVTVNGHAYVGQQQASSKPIYSRVERAKSLPDTGESSSVAMLVLGAILGAFGLVTVRRKN
ncbi:SEC10/PgrA surface exclusion domain-containing protein [Streptococcus oralis]|uniref:SEC10/PgrA surface exclusion domain-containing protein n=1 Tax=Streptococcus oralis TaxID=1303 RepID=UPI0022846071|nr:SEC10/PgrA surface exclusion domain-containing protein [Streptococcus oralis]MCY7103516.1 SEC10/PgrA surface exclusion domain-containing protein [Streptococcus oralis]